MKAPRGTVTATTAAKKARIWTQPLPVTTVAPSETLRLQQPEGEVGEEQHRQRQPDAVFEVHALLVRPARRPARRPRRAGRTGRSASRRRGPSSRPQKPATAPMSTRS